MSTSPTYETAIDDIIANAPWLDFMPGLVGTITTWLEEGVDAATIVSRVRQTDEYRNFFPGMFDTNGQMRFSNEREYLDTVASYRTVLRNYVGEAEYDDAYDFVGFMELDMSPDELASRLSIWDTVKRNSQEIKSAFFVYAGLEVSDEQLYDAIVDPTIADTLTESYQRNLALNPPDLDTFRDRLIQDVIGQQQAELNNLKNAGVLTQSQVTEQMANLTYERIQPIADLVIATGGQEQFEVSLASLQRSLNFALIGSAATQYGFELPTEDKVQEYVAAGVDRQQALEAYGLTATQGGMLAASVQRAGLNIDGLTGLTDAALGVDARQATVLQQALSQSRARVAETGGFAAQVSRSGQVQSQGLRLGGGTR